MMTVKEMIKAKEDIDNLSQMDMARLWRFAPMDHPYFNITNGDLPEYFKKKFEEKGGFTSDISKAIGWR